MRHAHYIKPNARSQIPSAAIWFDTETLPIDPGSETVEHRLWFGWACFQRRYSGSTWTKPKWCYYETIPQYWDFVCSNVRGNTRLYLFCHNTSFDLPILDIFHELPLRGWKMVQAIIDAPPTILKFTKGRSSIVVLDTLNLWRLPLATLGEMIGAPKLDYPDDLDPMSDWITYGKQDVDVIRIACHQWWQWLRDEDMGGFASTLAGQSIRTWRHRFMKHQVLVDDNALALDISRAAYCGGRTEAFVLGDIEGPIWCLDVNSMYPAVMRDHDMPARLWGATETLASEAIRNYRRGHIIAADVVIETEEPAYPLVRDGRLIFPVGRFRTHLIGPDLDRALDADAVIKVHRAAIYKPDPIFRDFVSELYDLRCRYREAGDATRSWLVKILMNSLYGKFGQRGIVWDEFEQIDDLSARRWDELDYDTGVITKWRQLGGLRQRQLTEKESRESSPAIAACVTAWARTVLWDTIKQAGNANVYYCDTDSVWVNGAGKNALSERLDNTTLGGLKVEAVADNATIYGLKDYRFGTKERHKGIRSKATWIDGATARQERWSSLKGLLRTGKLTTPTTTPTVKHLSRKYTKGNVHNDGRVLPLRLEDGA